MKRVIADDRLNEAAEGIVVKWSKMVVFGGVNIKGDFGRTPLFLDTFLIPLIRMFGSMK